MRSHSDRTDEGRQRADPRLWELRRIKLLALGVLLLSAAIAVAAKVLEPRHWVFGYVSAWATAATVGGLADWYAVVALFRHPLGLPFPHSAIIAQNQDRIAESFGRFVEEQFLAPEPVAEKLGSVDFAGLAANWLADEGHSRSLASFALRLLPQALAAIDETGLRAFLAKHVVERLGAMELAPLAGNLLGALVEDDRHQRVFDEILIGLNRLLGSQETLDAIREKIRSELPSLLSLFRADAYLVKRFIVLLSGFIEEARANPDHALRREFDQFLKTLIEKLKTSPEYAEKAEALKHELLARPEVANLADAIWFGIRRFLEQEGPDGSSGLAHSLTRFFVDIGRTLTSEPRLSADINTGTVTVLMTFVETQKSQISLFISSQIKSWDVRQMISIVELNIGKDLQYIRLNGTIIGGFVGLLIYAVERFVNIN